MGSITWNPVFKSIGRHCVKWVWVCMTSSIINIKLILRTKTTVYLRFLERLERKESEMSGTCFIYVSFSFCKCSFCSFSLYASSSLFQSKAFQVPHLHRCQQSITSFLTSTRLPASHAEAWSSLGPLSTRCMGGVKVWQPEVL